MPRSSASRRHLAASVGVLALPVAACASVDVTAADAYGHERPTTPPPGPPPGAAVVPYDRPYQTPSPEWDAPSGGTGPDMLTGTHGTGTVASEGTFEVNDPSYDAPRLTIYVQSLRAITAQATVAPERGVWFAPEPWTYLPARGGRADPCDDEGTAGPCTFERKRWEPAQDALVTSQTVVAGSSAQGMPVTPTFDPETDWPTSTASLRAFRLEGSRPVSEACSGAAGQASTQAMAFHPEAFEPDFW